MKNVVVAPGGFLVAAAISALTMGCSSSSKPSVGVPNDAGGTATATTPGFNAAAIQELRDSHTDKYIGKAPLTDTSTNAAGDTVYKFPKDTSPGKPVCFLGDQYNVVTHDAQSDNLLIFLQGGGACWDTLCAATSTAEDTIPKLGILNQDPTTNVVGSWNIVYGPYCDGSVFSGDNDKTGPAGQDWHFHGLANLTATIDVAKKAFPNAKRILLAGTSGGGYGTLTGTGIVRLEYPTTPLDVFNDAGLGLSNPATLPVIEGDWAFEQFVPASCTECKNGLTAIISWGLKADPTLRVSAFSSYGDFVIGGTFLQMQPDVFKPLLLTETGKVHDAYPTRFERFFIKGRQHTVIEQPDTETGATPVDFFTPVDGKTVEQFTKDMLDASPSWQDHLQPDDDAG